MLNIYPNVVETIHRYVKETWPQKTVSCQPNPLAWRQNRYIQISAANNDNDIVHYEYANGYLELHLEGNYYADPWTMGLYKYLRENLPVESGQFMWHRWYDKTQGRFRYEKRIEDISELWKGLLQMIEIVDPVIAQYMGISNPINIVPNNTSVSADGCQNDNQQVRLCNMKSLKDIFGWNLRIPEYQRIYCWPQKNVELILDDIFQHPERTHAYHLGTIILQKKDGCYDIIDGQQRLVTLGLILLELGKNDISLLQQKFHSSEAQKYVAYNKYLIETYVKRFCNESDKNKWAENILDRISMDALILNDSSLDLAYTFFSTQNARGKALTDYELLKSHHLRFIPEDRVLQQRHLAKRWDELLVLSEREENGDKSLSIVMGIYLYCLRKWTKMQTWYIKEPNRVKNEFESAPMIPDIPPFGEKFEFMDPIQGGTHFFAFVENFIQKYRLFILTRQYNIIWHTISCSGLLKDNFTNESKCEMKRRTHWWYGDVIATFLFAYYLKFGESYLAEALTCITRMVSQLRYEKKRANKQSILERAGEMGIILMINQATSPTFFLAEAKKIILKIPQLEEMHDIRNDYLSFEKKLYAENCKYYSVKYFDKLHIQ